MKRFIGALAVLLGVTGCYVYVPMAGVAPVPGQLVAMDITDAGRVALGGSIGPEIGTIEGRVVRDDGAEYEVSVSMVHLLRGGEQGWSGERVRLRKEFIARTYEKQLSKGRTAVASAGGVAIIALFAGTKIVGIIGGDEGKAPGDTAHSLRRPVRP